MRNIVLVVRRSARDCGFAGGRRWLAMLLLAVVVSCGGGSGEALNLPHVGSGVRSTAVYEIRLQSNGSDVLVVHAADSGDFESIDVHVPAATGVPDQHSVAFWHQGRLYESATGPDGAPDYTVYDPAKPMDVVGASVLGEFTARSFVASVEEAYEKRADPSSQEFAFVANNSAAVRAAFGVGDRSPNAIDFRGTLQLDTSGRPTAIDLRADKAAGLRLQATISYPAQPTVSTFVPVPQTTVGPCVTVDARGSYVCGPGVASGQIKVIPIPATTR